MAATDHRETVKETTDRHTGHIIVGRHELSRRFDGFEIHPLRALDKYNNVIHDTKRYPVVSYEQCEEGDEDIVFWGVYGHLKTGGLDNIADCATKEDAQDVASALDLLLFREENHDRAAW